MTFDDGVGGDGEGWDDEDADWGDLDDCKSPFCSNATMQALSKYFQPAIVVYFDQLSGAAC